MNSPLKCDVSSELTPGPSLGKRGERAIRSCFIKRLRRACESGVMGWVSWFIILIMVISGSDIFTMIFKFKQCIFVVIILLL